MLLVNLILIVFAWPPILLGKLGWFYNVSINHSSLGSRHTGLVISRFFKKRNALGARPFHTCSVAFLFLINLFFYSALSALCEMTTSKSISKCTDPGVCILSLTSTVTAPLFLLWEIMKAFPLVDLLLFHGQPPHFRCPPLGFPLVSSLSLCLLYCNRMLEFPLLTNWWTE